MKFDEEERVAKSNDNNENEIKQMDDEKVYVNGFTSSAQERLWMEQVRQECLDNYTNRIH